MSAGTVLITGAARRIGATIARALAADGWQVLAHCHRSVADAEALAAEIGAAGGRCEIVRADLADPDAVAALVPHCVARFGRVDALINNAASFRYDTALSFDADSLESHLRPNLAAPLCLARDVARAWLADPPAAGQGNIINLLDHKLLAPNPDFFTYTVAKLALGGATRLLAMAFEGHLRANGIAPGITLISGKQTESGFARAWAAPPLGRSTTPEELADAVRYVLATPSLNGQVLVLDGGESLLARRRDIAFDT